jgi:hypothetical protein
MLQPSWAGQLMPRACTCVAAPIIKQYRECQPGYATTAAPLHMCCSSPAAPRQSTTILSLMSCLCLEAREVSLCCAPKPYFEVTTKG